MYGRLELQQDGGTSSSGTGASSIDPRLTAMFSEATELVGVDRSRDELIEMMSDGSKKHVQTVSIVGFGGLGKTTLAKAVYDRVKAQFNCGAFVSVSRTPDITRIFKKMLYELDEEKYAGITEAVRDLEQLITELRRFMQYKRYASPNADSFLFLDQRLYVQLILKA
jgi:replication-associated recombination protein RarA